MIFCIQRSAKKLMGSRETFSGNIKSKNGAEKEGEQIVKNKTIQNN